MKRRRRGRRGEEKRGQRRWPPTTSNSNSASTTTQPTPRASPRLGAAQSTNNGSTPLAKSPSHHTLSTTSHQESTSIGQLELKLEAGRGHGLGERQALGSLGNEARPR